ncbi:MAG: RNA ligase (ATP) [Bacteroidetes bacterium]|nr:RNA ligase (ATP) [Bacteroidota bacterium]MBU1720463.1 RNA ligase (ATP) [Bacteroidota bacterium]
MRKLASIQRIKALDPIEGADAIERATVLGWQLVVKKDEFKVGDLVIYCEIDCLMPAKPEFEFLKPRGMRIRTIRLRGQISQGICFPLSFLPADFEIAEDADCTEVLGITKYEPPIPACLAGKVKGKFPSFIPKTDETRVQVLQMLLDKYKGEKCYVTEKVDGSSGTFYLRDDEFGVCSRNLELLEDDENSFWKVAREMDIENKLRSTGKNIAIQGELIGEGVQSNKLRLRGQTVRFFNAFDIDKFEYFQFDQFYELMSRLNFPMVPVITTEYILENDIDAIIKMAVRKSEICQDVWAEGIVIRPLSEKIDLILSNENFNNGRVSFKAINPEFLLKYGE